MHFCQHSMKRCGYKSSQVRSSDQCEDSLKMVTELNVFFPADGIQQNCLHLVEMLIVYLWDFVFHLASECLGTLPSGMQEKLEDVYDDRKL